MNSNVHVASVAGAAVLAFALVACGGDDSSGGESMSGMEHTTAAPTATPAASPNSTYNEADVSFAQEMIVHHQGAIEMAKLAATRASSSEVKDLATKIEAAQDPEITQMSAWLKAWGEPVSADEAMPGMDMSSDAPAGMMSSAQMEQLKAATGKSFDKMFLTTLIEHHKGAIAMAKTQESNGSDPEALALAKSIQTTQTVEVDQMSKMLNNV